MLIYSFSVYKIIWFACENPLDFFFFLVFFYQEIDLNALNLNIFSVFEQLDIWLLHVFLSISFVFIWEATSEFLDHTRFN